MKSRDPKRNALKLHTLDEVQDTFLGKRGTAKRDQFEYELGLELLGDMIRTARLERDLTQAELGKLVGVQKAQISKLERNASNVTIDTVLRVFRAMKAKVNFSVELLDQKVRVA
jgi:HTH-type transcriptional regulator/antitoxin HipB